ncbi:MAG: 3-oxoadipyl-CoA thiolase [Rhodobacteraceae bacterium]|nr:3-oxoadipyl-CoA thiolase [Paracoccaceae bacterium]
MTEAYICEGLRTPIGRFGGTLAAVRPDDMLAHVMKEVVASAPGLDPAVIDDAIMGCANQAGEDNRNVARMSVLLAGLPDSIGGVTVNRLCGSGLDAVLMAARAIKVGEADLVLAGGVESMSRAPFVMGKAETAFSRKTEIFDSTIGWRFVNKIMKANWGIESMPETAENVATDFNISRADQDAFAMRSQDKAATAIASGRLAQEIAPVFIPQRKSDPIIFDTDEHPRRSTLEKLGSLPTPFRPGGSITAGNASGVNDGAAAIIIASGAAVEKYGLKPKARVVAGAVAGVSPRIMGIGPVPSSKKLLERQGLKISDVDLIELNEAFAAQGLAVLRELGVADDADFVNPNGGAIALGHPLGMSGARLALTAAVEMQNNDLNRALCTMCVGVGQGISLMLEKV